MKTRPTTPQLSEEIKRFLDDLESIAVEFEKQRRIARIQAGKRLRSQQARRK
jgi:hypothetical protein